MKVTTIPAYAGTEPYIFVSYAHKDRDLIAPFLEELSSSYRVWYDAGITYGAEWEEEIIRKLKGCALFLYFVTEKSLESANCQDEIYAAREAGKPFVNILFEKDVTLPEKFLFRYGRFQMCKLYEFPSPQVALKDLVSRCEAFAPCKISLEESEKPDSAFLSLISKVAAFGLTKGALSLSDLQREFSLSFIKARKVFAYLAERGYLDGAGYEPGRSGPAKVLAKWPYSFPIGPVGLERLDLPYVLKPEDGPCCLQGKDVRRLLLPLIPTTGALTLPISVYFGGIVPDSLCEVIVPYGSKSIGPSYFALCRNLSSVLLPETLEKIEENAFAGVRGLTEIALPSSLKRIGEKAFVDAGLSALSIGKESFLEEIGCNAFSGNRFERLDLSMCHHLRRIERRAFRKCVRMVSLSLPSELGELGEEAFAKCVELQAVELPSSLREIKENTFAECRNLIALTLPKDHRLDVIRSHAFEGCDALRSVALPSGVRVESHAFPVHTKIAYP